MQQDADENHQADVAASPQSQLHQVAAAQLKAALLGLRKLKAKVAELEGGQRAPIAVVGRARIPATITKRNRA